METNNNKAYLVYESNIAYDSTTNVCTTNVCIFLDKRKAEEFIEALNIPYNTELHEINQCHECTKENEYINYVSDIESFKLKDICDRDCIEKDRRGYCCLNYKSSYDRTKPYFSISEVSIIE